MTAGSKFVTMLHRNRFHRIAIVLIYTLLEWILIAFIFLQAILSYFVSMYVSYFGLKPPCPLCSRVDHLFNAKSDSFFLSNVVCDDHVSEISQFDIRYEDRSHLERKNVSLAPMVKRELEAMSLKCLKCGEGVMLGIDLEDLMVKLPYFKGCDVNCQNLGKKERGTKLVDDYAIKRDEEGDGTVKLLSSHEEEALKPYSRAKAEPSSSYLEQQQDDDDGNIGKEEEKDSFPSPKSSSEKENKKRSSSSSSSSSEKESKKHSSSSSSSSSEKENKDHSSSPSSSSSEKENKKLFSSSSLSSLSSSSLSSFFGEEKQREKNNATYKLVYQCQDCTSQVTEHVSKIKSSDSAILDDKYFVGLKVKNGKVRMNEEEIIRFFKEIIDSEDDMGPHIFTVEIDMNHSYRGDIFLVSSVISNTIGTDDDDLSKQKMVKEVVGAKETQTVSDVNTMDREFTPVVARQYSLNKINDVSLVGEIDHASHKKVGVTENGNKTDAEVEVSEEECKIDGETGYEILTEREIHGEISQVEFKYENHESDANCVASIGTEIQSPETTQPETKISAPPKEVKMEEEMPNPEKIDEVAIFNKDKETEEMLVHENIDEVGILNKSGESEKMIVHENFDDDLTLNKSNTSEKEMTVLENIDDVPILNESNTSEEETTVPESIDEIQSVNEQLDHDLTEYENESNQSIDESFESEEDFAETMTMDDLKVTLKVKQKIISSLEAELDEERSASDISADQAMAKITRLTKEIAILKMEAEQEKRLVEERFEYDMEQFQKMFHNLDDLAKKREQEKQDVMKELIVYHRRVQILEGKLRKQMKDGSDNDIELDGNAGSSEGDITYMSVDDDVIMGYEKELGLAKYQSTLKELITEFEVERCMIHDQLMNAQQSKGELEIDNTREVDRFIKIGDEVDAAIKLLKDCVESLKNGEDNEVNLLRSIFQYYRHLESDSDELRDSAESDLINKLDKLQTDD